jgi:hypothetical protein
VIVRPRSDSPEFIKCKVETIRTTREENGMGVVQNKVEYYVKSKSNAYSESHLTSIHDFYKELQEE